MRFIFMSIILSLALSCTAEDCKDISLNEVESNLIQSLGHSYEEFQITKLYSKKQNHLDYFKQVLTPKFSNYIAQVEKEEFFFKGITEVTDAHIGVAIFTYKSKKIAKEALSNIETNGYFRNSKILTKYYLVNCGSKNILSYTESSADKRALNYLESITK